MKNDMQIVVATRNEGKVREIADLTAQLNITFLSMNAFPEIPDVEEDGFTFEDNALKKAQTISEATGLPTLADDSGLVVNALNGRPGVHSSRYAGENASDEDKYRKILHEMRNVSDELRTARFVCVLAFVSPDGARHVFHAECEGFITREPRGAGGFGYDPIFFYEPAGMTFGEMSREDKNKVSHRGNALRMFADWALHRQEKE